MTPYQQRTLARAQARIRADIEQGIVPPTVRGFEQLHDFVDANMYLLDDAGDFDAELEGLSVEEITREVMGPVIDALSAWLREGRHKNNGAFLIHLADGTTLRGSTLKVIERRSMEPWAKGHREDAQAAFLVDAARLAALLPSATAAGHSVYVKRGQDLVRIVSVTDGHKHNGRQMAFGFDSTPRAAAPAPLLVREASVMAWPPSPQILTRAVTALELFSARRPALNAVVSAWRSSAPLPVETVRQALAELNAAVPSTAKNADAHAVAGAFLRESLREVRARQTSHREDPDPEQMVLDREGARTGSALAARAPAPAATPKRGQLRNTVYMDVMGFDGRRLRVLTEAHDGTQAGIVSAASRLQHRADGEVGHHTQAGSRLYATDARGALAWVISPNLAHVSPYDSPDARETLGLPKRNGVPAAKILDLIVSGRGAARTLTAQVWDDAGELVESNSGRLDHLWPGYDLGRSHHDAAAQSAVYDHDLNAGDSITLYVAPKGGSPRVVRSWVIDAERTPVASPG